MQMRKVSVAKLVVGNFVHFYGGRFQVTENAQESQGHRPKSEHLQTAHGPANCAFAKAVCIEGSVSGYFKPGTEWTFQGTVGGLFAVDYFVEI